MSAPSATTDSPAALAGESAAGAAAPAPSGAPAAKGRPAFIPIECTLPVLRLTSSAAGGGATPKPAHPARKPGGAQLPSRREPNAAGAGQKTAPRPKPRRGESRAQAPGGHAPSSGGDRPAPRGPSARPNAFPKHVIDAAAARGVKYSELETTEESRYSCLMPFQFDQVAAAYAAEVGQPPLAAIDATANIGCDTIQLRRSFPGARITAIERDPATAACLAANMANLGRIIGGDPAPVEAVAADCVEYLGLGPEPRESAPAADLVYFDPPWGGPDYHKALALDLYLSGAHIGDVAGRALRRTAPLVVVKLPGNVNLAGLQERVSAIAPATFSVRDVIKSGGDRKGDVAFRLVFVRRAAGGAGAVGPSAQAGLASE